MGAFVDDVVDVGVDILKDLTGTILQRSVLSHPCITCVGRDPLLSNAPNPTKPINIFCAIPFLKAYLVK